MLQAQSKRNAAMRMSGIWMPAPFVRCLTAQFRLASSYSIQTLGDCDEGEIAVVMACVAVPCLAMAQAAATAPQVLSHTPRRLGIDSRPSPK